MQACDAFLEGRPIVAYEYLPLKTGDAFTFVSDNLSCLLGYSATALIAKDVDWFALIHPDEREAIAKTLKTLKPTETKSLRYRVRHQSGEYYWLQDDLRAIQRNDKTIILGSWLDISEQESLRHSLQQAQQDLKNAQTFTQELIEAIAEPVFIKDADDHYIYANQAFCQIVERPWVEICGKSDDDIFATEQAAKFREQDLQARELGEIESADIFQLDSLQNTYFATQKRCFYADQEYLFGLLRNETEVHLTRQALRQSIAHARKVADNVPGMMCRFTRDDQREYRFSYASNYCAQIFGVSPYELMANSQWWLAQVHPDDLDGLLNSLEQAIAQGTKWQYQWRLQTPDQSIKWLHGMAEAESLFDGRIVWDGIILDVSDRLAMETALDQSLDRFQKLSNNIPGMIYRLVQRADGTFKLLYCNDYVETIFEVSRDVAIADIYILLNLTHPDDRELLLDSIQESRCTLSKWHGEWRICLPSGQIKWLKGISEPHQQDNGETVWHGIMLDDSERKQAEQELLQNQNLQEIVIHTLQNLLKSPHQNFDAILQYLGQSFDTDYAFLICHNIPKRGSRVVSEWHGENSQASIATVFQNLEAIPESWWMQQVTQNQDIIIDDPNLLSLDAPELKRRLNWSDLKTILAIPILQTNQRPWGVLCLAYSGENARLFTKPEAQALRLIGEMLYVCAERQDQQLQLKASETKFREIFEHAAVGIAKLDQEFCFTQINKTLARMIGSTSQSLVGQPYWNISLVAEIEGDRQMFVELEENGFVQRETRIHQTLGREIWVKINLSEVQPFPPDEAYYIAIFEDISQRKRSEEMHADLVLHDKLLIKALAEVTYDHYMPQDILTWQGDYENILGYTPEEMGMDTASWLERVYPDDVEAVEAELERAFREDKIFDIEYRFRHHDGHYLWMHDRGVLHGEHLGEAERFIGVFRDISKRKAAEEKRQKQDRLYQQIVETAQEGIWVIDEEAKTDYVNPRMAMMLGYNAEDMLGKSLFEFMDSKQLEAAKLNFQRRQQGLSEDHDFCFRSREGQEVWTMITTNPLLDDHGKFAGALGMVTDVTERRAAEQEIIRSQNLLEAIFDESADALFLVDMDTLRTFDCNKKAIEMFERDDKSELIDIEGHILQAKQFSDEELEAIAAEINETGTWSREVEYVTKSGRLFWGNLAAKQITVGDRRVNLVRVTDIDDRKRAEQALRRTNEELERATKLKDEFLANMSHELRTPLNAILGLTEVLGDGTYGLVNQRQQRSLNTIERNGQHLLELINDILNLAKIEAGQMVFHPVPVEINQICRGSVVLIRHQASKKNIEIQLDLPTQSPKIEGDQLRLRQALINLLGNAIKFTPIGGKISLRLELKATENLVRIHIQDNGIGIAPVDQAQLFQPFVQLDSSLTRRFSGTGLGLALVKQIAELHGGSISVTSTLGKGSEFLLCLPWSAPSPLELPTASAPSFSPNSQPHLGQTATLFTGDRPLVLIADDDDDNIETIWDYLMGRGYRLIRAVNGREAVTLTESEQPDLILMDIQMPELNGLEAMQLIREQSSINQVPIIALTALAMDSDRQRCLDAGANLYLAKPFRLKTLIEHMQTLLASMHSS